MQRLPTVISARFGAPEPKESDAGQRSFASASKRPKPVTRRSGLAARKQSVDGRADQLSPWSTQALAIRYVVAGQPELGNAEMSSVLNRQQRPCGRWDGGQQSQVRRAESLICSRGPDFDEGRQPDGKTGILLFVTNLQSVECIERSRKAESHSADVLQVGPTELCCAPALLILFVVSKSGQASCSCRETSVRQALAQKNCRTQKALP